jgi:hypothetical protein
VATLNERAVGSPESGERCGPWTSCTGGHRRRAAAPHEPAPALGGAGRYHLGSCPPSPAPRPVPGGSGGWRPSPRRSSPR